MGADRAKIGMALFIATEIMFFAGLVSAYWILRAGIDPWPPLDQPRLPVVVTGINTFILLLSGVSLWVGGGRALKKGCHLCLVGWIGIAALLGLLFIGIQGYEWVRLLHFGFTTVKNIYAGTFYLIVGAHGVHLLAALIVLFILLRHEVGRHEVDPADPFFAVTRLFWSFVVLLWPVLYAVVYF